MVLPFGWFSMSFLKSLCRTSKIVVFSYFRRVCCIGFFFEENYNICTIFSTTKSTHSVTNAIGMDEWPAYGIVVLHTLGWVKDGEARRDIATMHTNVCKWWAPPGDGLNCKQRTLSFTPNLVLFCGIELPGEKWTLKWLVNWNVGSCLVLIGAAWSSWACRSPQARLSGPRVDQSSLHSKKVLFTSLQP